MPAHAGQLAKSQPASAFGGAALGKGVHAFVPQAQDLRQQTYRFFFRAGGALGDLALRSAVQDEGVQVLDDPLDDLALFEFHGLSERGWEVDVPLLAVLTFDELNFGGVAHGGLLSYI